MMRNYTRRYRWGKLTVQTDFVRPETPVLYRIDNDDEWQPTPFQAANFYRMGAPDERIMLRTVNDWLAGQAG